MNNQNAYWIWLQETIGCGSRKISNILSNFTFAEDFYRASLEEKLMCGCFSQKDINKLKNTSLDNARRTINRCKECEIDIITIGDVAYPKRLMEIDSPPAVIYIKGNKEVLGEEFSVAMVGTRTATPYGTRSAFKFAYDLAKNDAVIISGGALGIDTFSHRGALQADGKTVCVLGCGIEYRYLRENDELKKQMIRKGAVISEYPPDARASRYTFPQRNRIISGLSKGVLIIEAGSKSGSLITASLALEQGRDVFAVPGDISSSVSFGTNELIKDGAKAVTSAEDIIKFYKGDYKDDKIERRKTKRTAAPKKEQTFEQFDIIFDNSFDRVKAESFYSAKYNTEKVSLTSKIPAVKKTKSKLKTVKSEKREHKEKIESPIEKISEEEFNDLSENSQKVLLAFDNDVMHVDRIVEKSGLPINIVHSVLTQLEMYDYIEQLEGRNYKIRRSPNGDG